MTSRLKVNPEVLSTYIRRSNVSIEYIRKKIPKIDDFLTGNLGPTFNQLSILSKLINVPAGLLVLDSPMAPNAVQVDFRTLNSQQLTEMSSELKDTILEMQDKQEFLKDVVENDCFFVGMFDYGIDQNEVIDKARTLLGVDITQNRFNEYRKVLGDLGVFVFLNGKYKDNTHRPLDLNEFRGFTLSDKKAPIIFINQLDSKTGQLFTLIHEFIHLFYGESDLLEGEATCYRSKKEAIINAVTAEILAPRSLVMTLFDEKKPIRDNLSTISKRCEVSQFVILRRLYDLSMISKATFTSVQSKLENEFEQLSQKKASSGGSYKNNLRFRMDKNFFKYASNAVYQNKITYTDAFSIIGVGYKGYKILSRGVG